LTHDNERLKAEKAAAEVECLAARAVIKCKEQTIKRLQEKLRSSDLSPRSAEAKTQQDQQLELGSCLRVFMDLFDISDISLRSFMCLVCFLAGTCNSARLFRSVERQKRKEDDYVRMKDVQAHANSVRHMDLCDTSGLSPL
jgi:hypothetical protein